MCDGLHKFFLMLRSVCRLPDLDLCFFTPYTSSLRARLSSIFSRLKEIDAHITQKHTESFETGNAEAFSLALPLRL